MPKILKSDKERLPGGIARIFAYGFDAAGFDTRAEPISLADGSRMEFIHFSDPAHLDAADGVIVPQGIFEKFTTRRSPFGARTEISIHKASLLERERQIFNLLRKGSWVCFLVGEIIDQAAEGLHLESISDTDLCKRILNAFEVKRRRRYRVDVPRDLRVRDNEFKFYVDRSGQPMTVFELPVEHAIERRVLVELDGLVVGFEFDTQLFFLPFQASDREWATALSIAKEAALAISSYRRNHIVEIPAWVDELRFKGEESLYVEINALLEKTNRLESQLESWKDFKGVLTTSGTLLRSKVIAILESFFQLEVDQVEETRVHAVIIGGDDAPSVMIQAASTERGIQIELLDQMDSHRKRHWPSTPMPAVLFINNDIPMIGIDARLKTDVPEELVKHARDLNILMVRTIDLLFLMRHLEEDPQRKSRLMHIFSSGGGWLKADADGYEVVS